MNNKFVKGQSSELSGRYARIQLEKTAQTAAPLIRLERVRNMQTGEEQIQLSARIILEDQTTPCYFNASFPRESFEGQMRDFLLKLREDFEQQFKQRLNTEENERQ